MHKHKTVHKRLRAVAFATLATLGAGAALAADPDPLLAGWLGREYTIDSASMNDHMPFGGKLTFTYDGRENVVRLCTRQSNAAQGPWRNDLVPGCSVTLTFSAGTRYCSVQEVKAGNAETLASCHRLRSQDLAMHPPVKPKEPVEMHDMIVFLVKTPANENAIQILIDSPSRVTSGGGGVGGIP